MASISRGSSSNPTDHDLPKAGSASAELRQNIHELWIDNAAKAGVGLTGFIARSPTTL